MKRNIYVIVVLSCYLIFPVGTVLAGDSRAVVYDGNKRLTVVTDQVIEFFPGETGNSKIRSIDPNAKVIGRSGEAKIWRLKRQKVTKSAQLPVTLSGNFSPVFRDASGKIKALPGNIIVFMDKTWGRDKVAEWASSRGLVVVKCLSTYNNIYVLKSPVGLKSLELSNKLRGTTGVRKVMPNWWSKAYRR